MTNGPRYNGTESPVVHSELHYRSATSTGTDVPLGDDHHIGVGQLSAAALSGTDSWVARVASKVWHDNVYQTCVAALA